MFDLLVKGGWVMAPILGFSLAALGVAIERATFLATTRRDARTLERARDLLAKGTNDIETCTTAVTAPFRRFFTNVLEARSQGHRFLQEALNYAAMLADEEIIEFAA